MGKADRFYGRFLPTAHQPAALATATAWELLLALLPEVTSTSMPIHRPVWRDWVSDWQKGSVNADYWKQVDAAAKLIVTLVGNDTGRWSKVLDHLRSVPEPHRKTLIERLRNIPVDQLDPQQRGRFAEHLRKTVQRHRDFPDAFWALPGESVDALAQALPRLMPEGLCERNAWLFKSWIDLEGFRSNWQGMQAEVDRLRADALREIVDQEGLDGVLKLAEIAESPAQVGATLAQADVIPINRVLPHLLRSSNPRYAMLAGGYARDRFCIGWEWVDKSRLEEWAKSDAGALLSLAGLNPRAWKLAERLGDEALGEYWKSVPTYGKSSLDQQQFEFACRKLLEAGRPEFAIDMLTPGTFDQVTVSPSLIMDAMTGYRDWINCNPDAARRDGTLHVVQELFDWLQRKVPFGDDEPTRRLGRLEWEFQLDGSGTYGAAPKTLTRCLSEDPKFFAELIAATYRSKNDADSKNQPTQEQAKIAMHGYRLLGNWNRVPGTQSDDSSREAINEDQLLAWLESARSLCRDSGHLEIADSKIGEMLARWPKPKDEKTMWPCEEICDAIEEVDSDDLDGGFHIGVLNNRGVTCRSPFDGGDLEYKERDKYRRWAEMCESEWPRTAACLRRVAESYEFQAQREDVRAEERKQERY